MPDLAVWPRCIWMTGNRSITTEKLNDRHVRLRSGKCRPGMRWYLNDRHRYFLSGGITVRIPQDLDVVAFWSWNLDVVVFQSWNLDVVAFHPLKKCLGITMSWFNCLCFSMSWCFSPRISMSRFFGLGILLSWFFGLGTLISWYMCLHGLVFVFIVKTEKPRKIF